MRRLIAFLILVCLTLTACGGDPAPTVPEATTPQTTAATAPEETVDYAAAVQPESSADTAKETVTVKSFVDGDTVHFYVPESVMPGGVLKARFLAINTPESTGKIEEYGKAASNFTRERLSAATEILIESETDAWNPDSTGGRYLVWVWYKTESGQEYRNLNIELLQNGLALPNSAAGNRYGSTCTAALDQAKREKLHLYSGQKDPDFYYGEAVELTLKELRTNIESYSGMKVAFSGIITANSGTQGVYVEDYDSETGLYYGIYIYYGHSLSGPGLEVLTVGNEARIVGTVQYYEGGGTWQISDLTYRLMQPDDPGNVQKLSEGHSGAFVSTTPEVFTSLVSTEQGEVPYAWLTMDTTLEMQGLKVLDGYTTDDEESSSYGAMTLYCEANGIPITVRTAPFRGEGGITSVSTYLDKTITVRGIVSYFDGSYQIKVLSQENIGIQVE